MLRLTLLFSFFFLVGIQSITFAQCEVLVWSDEFDGTGLPNSLYWGFDTGAGGWGNNEVQNYTNTTNNVRQENGKLIIEAKKSGNSWTSARVKSQGKKFFTYGKVVFRAKLPTGGGTWPALWMLGENITTISWPRCGEIDVMEHVGNKPNIVQSALHTPNNNGGGAIVASRSVPTATTEFHDYAVAWSADRIAFYVDDVLYHTYSPATKNNNNYPFNWDFFMIMNIAMGGNLGGAIAADLTYARMEVEYVRVYEERIAPKITGPKFVYENESNLKFTAPDYESGVTYEWIAPAGAEIITGQGSKEVTVKWGNADGVLQLNISGNTGCTNNSTQLSVTTIVEPSGDKYLAHSFADNNLAGWTKNGTSDATIQASGGKLNITYNTTELRYIQYELPKAVDVQNYSIIKLPITIPATSATVPGLIMTFRDGNGNETIATSYELNASKKDGLSRTYSKDFSSLWNQNTPAVNPNLMKYVRVYMLPGRGSFSLGDLYFYNSKTSPTAPTGLTAQINGEQVTLSWNDASNATGFHLYKSSTENGTYTREKTNIPTSENPFLIIPTSSRTYYKVSGTNAIGESPLSSSVEAIALITATENELRDISVYPNPSSGKFHINLSDRNIDRIDFFDLQGRSISYDSHASDNALTLTLNQPVPGIYFLKLIRNNAYRIHKIVIQ